MEGSVQLSLSALAAVLDLEHRSNAGIGRENLGIDAIGANFALSL